MTTNPQCVEMVHGRVSVGVMGRGRESTVPAMPHRCTRAAVDGSLFCAQHGKARKRMDAALDRRRNTVRVVCPDYSKAFPNVEAATRWLAHVDKLGACRHEHIIEPIPATGR